MTVTEYVNAHLGVTITQQEMEQAIWLAAALATEAYEVAERKATHDVWKEAWYEGYDDGWRDAEDRFVD